MEIEIDEIYEKEMLIDAPKNSKWTPDMKLLMYIASFDDWGAGKSTIEENKKEMITDGLNPQKIRFKLMIHVEYLD